MPKRYEVNLCLWNGAGGAGAAGPQAGGGAAPEEEGKVRVHRGAEPGRHLLHRRQQLPRHGGRQPGRIQVPNLGPGTSTPQIMLLPES